MRMAYPLNKSNSRSGACFDSSKGRGSLKVKCLSKDRGRAYRLTHVTVGSCAPVYVTHDFSWDTLTCRVPGTWNFLEASDAGHIEVRFAIRDNTEERPPKQSPEA